MANYLHADPALPKLLRQAGDVMRANQHACWPVRNITRRRWWQFWRHTPRELEKWSIIQVEDPSTGEGMRDLYISPDGRIGTGHLYPRAAMMVGYVREVPKTELRWDIDNALRRLIAELPHQSRPGILPANRP